MAKDCQGVGFAGDSPMLRIITEVDAPPGQAIGVKEALAMEAERYGDTRVISVVEVLPEQMKLQD